MSSAAHEAGGFPSRWSAASFAGRLREPERDRLLRLGRRVAFGDGEHLLQQGDQSRHLVLLVSGRAEVQIRGRTDRLHRVAQRTNGDLVGELAFIDSRARSASVVASGAVSALLISPDAFNRFLEQSQAAHRALTRLLADRLRASDIHRLEQASDVLTRVARALHRSVMGGARQESVISVYLTQRELARSIGASQVSVHRVLRRLTELGVIATAHRSIIICDVARLAELAADREMHHLM